MPCIICNSNRWKTIKKGLVWQCRRCGHVHHKEGQ